MTNISIIAAVAENGAIGVKGTIPWHLSGDFKYFKKTTMGCPIIMGRTTWNSIGCKCLPGRRNLVVSTRTPSMADIESGAEFHNSIESALEASASFDGEVFIIGGASIYHQTLLIADRVYLTIVHTVVEDGDAFFPEMDNNIWKVVSISEMQYDEKSDLSYEFLVYERK